MNRINPEAIYRFLPAVHRLRDADRGEPLHALISVLAREGAVVEESIEQLLDNLFIETCDDWAAPYIGGTIGYRTLHPIEGEVAGPRAEVANTIGYRRRKGTAAVLEQLARDVTGWPAKVVEYFQLVATCQHMNHIRPDHHLAPDLHDPLDLEPLGRAFDPVTRAVDVRSIEQSSGRRSIGGKHNLPNIGIFLWRLGPHSRREVPATPVGDGRRFLLDPLGAPRQLVNRPLPEDAITALARPVNVPGDVTRRMLHADPGLWYGPGRSIVIFVDGVPVPVTRIEACDLSDDGPGWNHSPHNATPIGDLNETDPPEDATTNVLVRVDPELGRFAFPEPEPGEVRATWHTGFPAPIGGGEYDRAASVAPRPDQVPVTFPSPDHPTLQSAIGAVEAEGGIVEVNTNDIVDAPATITPAAGAEVILRAVDGVRPVLRASQPVVLSGAADARIIIDGFVLEGEQLRIVETPVGVSLASVTLRHVTLIPGLGYAADGRPTSPEALSLEVETTGLELTLDKAITGRIEMTDTTNATIRDSIVDAGALDASDSPAALAISGPGGADATAGALTIHASTILGRIVARSLPLVSNSILHARAATGEAPVRALRRQEGCLRFSYVPPASVVPRRYRCQPQLAIDQAVEAAAELAGAPLTNAERAVIASRIERWLVPGFTALGSSHPAYCQLRQAAPGEIRRGASDESEMGAYHLLFAPQRESNLRIRIEEYLRFGLEAGVFFETGDGR